MSKQKKKFIRKVAAGFWSSTDRFPLEECIRHAETLAEELQKRGYFDPEPEQVEKEIPWRPIVADEFPKEGQQARIRFLVTDDPAASWENLFCFSNGMILKRSGANFWEWNDAEKNGWEWRPATEESHEPTQN